MPDMMPIRKLERLADLLAEYVQTHPPADDPMAEMIEISAADVRIVVNEEIAERRRATGHVVR